jgi:hypothetical protein
VRYVHYQLERELPLASEQPKTNVIDLFAEWLGKIINASRKGQLDLNVGIRQFSTICDRQIVPLSFHPVGHRFPAENRRSEWNT